MMRRSSLALALALLFFMVVLPSPARADARPPAGVRSLGILTSQPVATLEGAPPSKGDALGTVLVAWCEDPFGAPRVRLGEWSLLASRWITTETVRRAELCPTTLRMAWSRQRLVFVLGHDSAATTEVVVLARSGGALTEAEALVFTNAEAPSLDADDGFIALATYERRAPLTTNTRSSKVEPPFHALHVRLLDPATLRVAGARVFSGPHLLRRHASPEAAGHALRLLDGRLYVAVADDEPRIVGARLPSLATEVERTFPVPPSERTPSSSSIVLGRMGTSLVIGVGTTLVLSPRLAIIAKHALPITQPIAYDAASRRVLATDGPATSLDRFRVRVVESFARKEGPYALDGEPLGILYAHGRGVLFGALDQPNPGQSGPALWAIRVLP
jgi:hypothetical protein